MLKKYIAICLLAFLPAVLSAQEPLTAKVSVKVDEPGVKVSPSLYGIFFEEINLAGDGGIYPELVRNRSFEFNSEKPEFWTTETAGKGRGKITLEENPDGSEFNRHVLRVEREPSDGGCFLVVNEGYWGIPVVKDGEYDLVFRVKAGDDYDSGLVIMLMSSDLVAIRSGMAIQKLEKEWKTYTLKMTSIAYDPKAKLAILSDPGTFWLDYVSLKPVKTYKNHGLRPDLMEKLAALKPAFVRFPGGCWVEGDSMKEASRWKRTIGDPAERWTQPNLWGYKSTNGLGFHEYLQMCEDLGADAMFVINCGMAHRDHVPMEEMDEFVQDALDAIEYANGPADSEWGKVRAVAGHPEPFRLKYLEIGNENGGPVYWERYDLFFSKIREKYPEIELIANEWGGGVSNKQPIEILDEHYYSDPRFFIQHADKYDSYDRAGMKVYVGEYAVTQDAGQGNLNAAIGEAAFMTGMERNSDVVVMASYAPLFVNVNHRSWNPDLICFDGTRSYGIPSYYIQQLFSVHRADVIVPTEIRMENAAEDTFSGRVGVGSWETKAEYKDAKIVKDGVTLYEASLAEMPENAKSGRGDWKFADGTLRQNTMWDDCRFLFGDESWGDYTFSVKARKLEGREGFLILFNATPDGRWAWVNIGGWQNTGTAFQTVSGGGTVGKRTDFTVEAGRWYDIRVETKGKYAKCFVDGELVAEAELPLQNPTGVYAVSGLDASGEELIMKIVNTAQTACSTEISLEGVTKLGAQGTAIILTSESGLDENTLEEPEKVSPKTETFSVDSAKITRTLPAKSLTVLRVKVK